MARSSDILKTIGFQKIFIISVVSALCVAIAACGFRPLYGEAGGADAKALASVSIAQIKDRSGQKLRNFLLERMAPNAGARESRYTLNVELTENKSEFNIRNDESATRANLSISANFTLTNVSGGGGIFRGTILSTNSYNVLESDFATLSAENEARNRALRSLAEEIRLRVAMALRNPAVFSTPVPATPRPR